MNQLHTPLYSALVSHFKKEPISYHVPGHKSGMVFSQKGYNHFESILKLDMTEISGLDDLHDPEGAILEAQQLTARLYGVKESFFLVNGSTVGNLAMILATCEEGDTVLVQRNSHKSVMNGLQLAGVKPVFLAPEYDSNVKVASNVSENAVIEALRRYPKAKALLLTNPNYYGMSADLSMIVKLAHENGTVVLVDEAHGAHFMSNVFPSSAIVYGADIVVHSAHKTLPALTMGSYLHFNSDSINIDRLKYYLQMLQSSSPSYPIMASLDLARHYLASLSPKDFNLIMEHAISFRDGLNRIDGLKVVQSTDKSIDQDILKITVQSECNLSGYELHKRFENEGIYTELADPNNTLFVLALSKMQYPLETLDKINESVRDVTKKKSKSNREIPLNTAKISELAIQYKEQKGYNKKVVPIKESIGEIAAEMVTPYPPGIPILVIGENITSEHVDLLLAYKSSGSKFQGSTSILNNSLEVFT